jgi:hypothetical protein
VYEIYSATGAVVYVGKGSNRRLADQRQRFGLDGAEIARFAFEVDAYDFERTRIAEINPVLNRIAGGGGVRKQKVQAREPRRTKEEMLMDRLGTRVYAARCLLRFDLRPFFDQSKIEQIRQVAYG